MFYTNKSELINELSTKADISVSQAEVVVNTTFEAISQALGKGQRVEMRGFGSFMVRDYKPYKGRNPRTGESIRVRAKKMPSFKAGKELRDYLREN